MNNRLHLLWSRSVDTLRTSGFRVLAKKVTRYIGQLHVMNPNAERSDKQMMDVLFVTGCMLAHPVRYRVFNQREQLLAFDIHSSEIYYENLTCMLVPLYRAFVFFRCPCNDMVRAFIQEAHAMHKIVFFDVDDLVIDTKYTSDIPYLAQLPLDERQSYAQGVLRMRETLELCDGAITSTNVLADELRHYVPNVWVNRNMISEKLLYLSEAAFIRGKKVTSGIVKIGYFSGSPSHVDDLSMIQSALLNVMRERPNVRLVLVGEQKQFPQSLTLLKQVEIHPLVHWEKLPELIASCDINIVPLVDTLFNRAKSENKWMEAALVRVPTVASDVGAFHESIENNMDGVLCNPSQWEVTMLRLVDSAELRLSIGKAAYDKVVQSRITLKTGKMLRDILLAHMQPSVAFVLPSTQVSGGALVAAHHAQVLQKNGYNVVLLSSSFENGSLSTHDKTFPIYSINAMEVRWHFQKMIATAWNTLETVERYPNVQQRFYLVQGYESLFDTPSMPRRISANQTYCRLNGLQYITVSDWCQNWLRDVYGQEVLYTPNGIDVTMFVPQKRNFSKDKIRILIEGNSNDEIKKVDESFRIVACLNSQRYEIWYLSYEGKPKSNYHIDRFFFRVPHEEIPALYLQCDVLLKSSQLESFSYPPLEMMSTGGMVVMASNEGNQIYAKHEENCLLYRSGNTDEAVDQIQRLLTDSALRDRLYYGGIETAKALSWTNMDQRIENAYGISTEVGAYVSVC